MKLLALARLDRLLAGIAVAIFGTAAQAAPICGSSGTLAACVDFQLSGTTLTVTLTNTSSADVTDPASVLTALFFGYNGALTPVSATTGGSTYLNGVLVSGAGTNVGGEWAYGTGLSGAPLGANSGISSSGFGLFGNGNFNGANLAGPVAVDGVQYGITSAGDNLTTENGGIANNEITKNSVIFVLSGFTGTLADIGNISFQYGTALTETNVPPPSPGEEVPEPGSLALIGLGLLGLAATRRRRT